MKNKMKNLKKIYFITATVICFAAIAVSCKPNEPEAKPVELVLADYTMTLTEKTFGITKIVSGNGGYSVTSSAPAIATATVTDSVIQIDAISAGSADIRVVDSREQADTFTVTIEAMPTNGFFFDFLNKDGQPLPNGGSLNGQHENGKSLIKIRLKPEIKGNIKAKLKISLLNGSTANIDYCGWGAVSCTSIEVGQSLENTMVVSDNNVIDPDIKLSTAIDASTSIQVRYDLIYTGKTQDTTQSVTWLMMGS